MQRPAGTLAGCKGEPACVPDGTSAVFAVGDAQGTITVVGYRCTTCVTLVAFCEHLCDLVRGRPVSEAIGITEEKLLAFHSEVPPERQDRATIAVQALRSALRRLSQWRSD